MNPLRRVTLIFGPQASPTYTPLGIAWLAGYLRQHLPGCEVTARDLNLRLWERVARQTPGGPEYLRFCRGLSGSFYDEAAYRGQGGAGDALEAGVSAWSARVRRWLAGRGPGGGGGADGGGAGGSGAGGDGELLGLLDGLAAETAEGAPELIGLSLFSFAQLSWALALALRLRAGDGFGRAGGAGRPWILLGGAACAALRAEDVLEACPAVDGVVVGEGEPGLAALCRGEPLAAIPGLVHREGGVPGGPLRRNRLPDAISPRLLAPPTFDGLAPALNPTPVLPTVLTRGCKWRRCRFCAHNASFAGYRTRRVEDLVEELAVLGELHGARHFYFADLYVDPLDLELFAEAVLARGLEIRYHVLGRPLDAYTPERLAKLAASGCRWISWGVESGSQRLLDLADKGTQVAVIERVLRDAHAAGISNLAMMIYGLPTSRPADLDATFALVERIYDHVDAFTATAFALFERSGFGRRAREFGLAVTGRQVELRVGTRPVHSLRLDFRELAEDGSLRPPCGPLEVAQWHRRRAWLGEPSFLEGLPCEHYLLYVSRRAPGIRKNPLEPLPRDRPFRRAA